jgi:hypothetical protein
VDGFGDEVDLAPLSQEIFEELEGLDVFLDLDGWREIGVGTKNSFAPPFRTGQANFSHPALQLVVSLQRRSAVASRARFRFEH